LVVYELSLVQYGAAWDERVRSSLAHADCDKMCQGDWMEVSPARAPRPL